MNIFKEILSNPYYAAGVIFLTQIMMSLFRTLNILYTTKDDLFGAIWSNNAVSITWLLSMTIGLNSMLTGQWQPILGFLVGGSIGTYIGITLDTRNKRKENE